MNKYSHRNLIKKSQDNYKRDKEGYIIVLGGKHEFENEKVKVYNTAEVIVYGHSTVDAHESSKVEAHDSSEIVAYHSSEVTAYDSSKVYVYSDLVKVTDKSNGRAEIVEKY